MTLAPPSTVARWGQGGGRERDTYVEDYVVQPEHLVEVPALGFQLRQGLHRLVADLGQVGDPAQLVLALGLVPYPPGLPGALRRRPRVDLFELLPYRHAQADRVGDASLVEGGLQVHQGLLRVLLGARLDGGEVDVTRAQVVDEIQHRIVPRLPLYLLGVTVDGYDEDGGVAAGGRGGPAVGGQVGSLGVRPAADQVDGVDEEEEAEHEEQWAQVAAPDAAVADDHLDRPGT